ncbi:hypothetical protein EV678_1039 [Azospira oryzae]|uniref:DUF3108 domain-containing protein n=1 Tax=Azospira oryzae TaxID=146939 RepID=A0ABY0IRK6_9RHOO|nr:hypothetical protein [Azospira oryzae]RZT90228.1 hypothetical protein EV678_1039 [Azospira oryzae]
MTHPTSTQPGLLLRGFLLLFLAGSLQAAPWPSPVASYQAVAAGEGRGEDILLAAAPDSGLEVSYDAASRRLHLHYPMAFNQLTEGWSWRPLADPASEDYYRFKYLPLGSVNEERDSYVGEDKIGEPETMRVLWRYDYFLAFDNLYDFMPRGTDDEAGFDAELTLEPEQAAPLLEPGAVSLIARVHLQEPYVSESTTFWKAIHARPTDFTLKKRYLIGEVEEIRFVTGQNRVLAQLLRHPQQKQQSGKP